MPAVSVILPVFNGEKFLAEAIDSVCGQTFSDWELIIVDDGSADRSGAVADRYSMNDRRIRVIHAPNGGLSVARNRGIDAARSPWIYFLDADDAMHPRALELLLDAADLSDEVDLAVGGFSFDRRQLVAYDAAEAEFDIMAPPDLIGATLYQRPGIVHTAWGKLYRKVIFDAERFTPGLYYEDLDFFYRYALRCRRTAVSTAPLYFYRQHPASIMHTWDNRRLDVLRVTERIERDMADRCPQLVPAARDRRLSANFNVFVNASRAGQPDVARMCWTTVRRYRLGSLFDRRVRAKNKVGVMLSFFGKRMFRLFAKWAGA